MRCIEFRAEGSGVSSFLMGSWLTSFLQLGKFAKQAELGQGRGENGGLGAPT